MGSFVKFLTRRSLRTMVPSLRLDRLWWYLALICLFSLVGHEIAKTTGVGLAVAAELEGFGDDVDEEDEAYIEEIIVPPSVERPGPQTDRGPPEESKVDPAVDLQRGKTRARERNRQMQSAWDEDEFEGLPEPEEDVANDELSSPSVSSSSSSSQAKRTPAASRRQYFQPGATSSYHIEAISVVVLLIYGVVFWFGKKANEKLALAWAEQFAAKEDSIFAKNFSLLGTGSGKDDDDGEALLMKEGQNVFKFYASGRRCCEGLLATLELKSRHDLISLLWYLISPRQDDLTIDVYMNDESMEPFVFAVSRRRVAKAWHKETKDLQKYGTLVDVTSFAKKWPSDELAVITDTREAAEELLTDAVIDQVFGEKVLKKFGASFVSMHFSDQSPYGSHKKMLRFKFSIPDSRDLATSARLIALVPYYIDQVGRFKLSAQARAKAMEARTKVAEEAFKEKERERLDALQRKKDEKRRLEEEARKKLSPEALRKLEEKEKARQLKKSMPKIKLSRGH